MTDPDSINLHQLTAERFEELCFDLLVELGYERLSWRQGGGDGGRDIQGWARIKADLVGAHDELWFFECKCYEGGVSPDILHSKIAWADAERPKHLVFFVTSHITNPCRAWVRAISRDKFYSIHVLEGKQIKSLIARFPTLVRRYFSAGPQILMRQAYHAWIHHNLVPEPWLLRTLADTLNLSYYSPGELAFLWASLKLRLEAVNAIMADSWGESYDDIFGLLKGHANASAPLLDADDQWSLIQDIEGFSDFDVVYRKVFAAQVAHLVDNSECIALYALVRDDDGEGIEVLVNQDSSLTYKIRHITSAAKSEVVRAKRLLGLRDL